MAKKRMSTQQWEDLEDSIKGRHAKKFNAIMSDMEHEDFCNMYLKILEYVQPKIQRQEIVEEVIQDRTIKYEYIDAESDKDIVDKDEDTSK